MSENIFKELYSKVLSLFRQTENTEENAKSVACNRLRVVLMQDRTNLTPELLQRMRKELVELLSKYVEMDKDALELNFDQEGDQMALMLSIPVIRAKDEAEIEKAIKEQEEKEKETDEENSEDEGSESSDDETSEDENEENGETSDEDTDNEEVCEENSEENSEKVEAEDDTEDEKSSDEENE